MMRELEVDGAVTPSEAAEHVEDQPAAPREPVVITGSITKPPNLPASGFFDPDNPDSEPDIILERVLLERKPKPASGILGRIWQRILLEIGDAQREEFRLAKPVAFYDDQLEQVIIVPANLGAFTTDLTSVPRLFTWLIPRTGVHLPAAILHDGLVHGPNEEPTYIADTEIPREESDRILRDAMRGLGATWARRWLVWATVLIATLAGGRNKMRWLPTIAITCGIILAFGTAATIDLIDCKAPLPWMGDLPWWRELLHGGGVAVIVSAVLALVGWGGHRRAGLIFGLALALLLHVTVAVALVFAIFGAVEAFLERRVIRFFIYFVSVAVIVGAIFGLAVAFC